MTSNTHKSFNYVGTVDIRVTYAKNKRTSHFT